MSQEVLTELVNALDRGEEVALELGKRQLAHAAANELVVAPLRSLRAG